MKGDADVPGAIEAPHPELPPGTMSYEAFVDWADEDPLPDVERPLQVIAADAHARYLVEHASAGYIQALLDELRRPGRLPEAGAGTEQE